MQLARRGARALMIQMVCVGGVLCGVCGAQVVTQQRIKPAPDLTHFPKSRPPSDVKVPLIDQPLRLADFAGMKPKPGLAKQLGEVTGFIQNQPTDGQPATERTEVWLGHTKSVFYVVFLCFDKDPKLIRSHLTQRDDVGNNNTITDDNVFVLLDPFQDRRRGILFQVNPAGVQSDAAWTDQISTDYSYDTVWDSDGKITNKGWMALLAIPFRSIRSRPTSSDWGVVFERNIPRNSETDTWPRIFANISGTMSQEGTLQGMAGMMKARNVQFTPYVLGQNEKTLLNLDPLNPYFSKRTFEGTAGGELKAILKESIVFDATVNPDFSDIASDQPQLTVNQRYSVFFPELRPFFLENANYLTTPISLVYTRDIARPEFGARLTGKAGNTNLGFLLIDDRLPGQTVGVGDPLYGKRATFAVGRVSHDFGQNLTLGTIYTDEEFGGGWNRIGGADFEWRATQKWRIQAQTVESSTKGSNPKSAATVFPKGYAAGPASYLEVDRSGHAFSMQNTFQDYSTGFQSNVGFIQTTNFYNEQTHAQYQWYPEHSNVQVFGVETHNQVAFDHQGNRLYHYTSFDPYIHLPRNLQFATIFGQNSDTQGPQDGYPMTSNVNFTENYVKLFASGAPSTQFNFNISAQMGGNVNYNPVAGGTPFLLKQDNVQALFTVQPLKQLTDSNTYLLDRDFNAHSGQFVYETQTFRTQMNYQFTRALSARVIVEYDSTLANPLETSLLRTKGVQTQALLEWLPSPGTAVYIGYTNDIQNLDRGLCNRMGDGGCDPNNTVAPRSTQYLNDQRQYFVKASYLFWF